MDPRISWHQREHLGPCQEDFDRLWSQAVSTQNGDTVLLSDINPHSLATSRSGSKMASRCGSPGMVDDTELMARFIHDSRFKASQPQLKNKRPTNLLYKRHSCDELNEDEASSSRSSSTASCAAEPPQMISPGMLARTFLTKPRPENIASTYDLHRCQRTLTSAHRGTPWVPENRTYSSDALGLHEDIVDFCKYMSPTAEEQSIRMRVFERLQSVIHSVLPDVVVDYFGSFRTGLFLPTSDIDAVVLGQFGNMLPLVSISQAISDHGIAAEGSIKVLDKASVPIIKYMDKATDIRVDISFNMTNGVKSAELIKVFLNQYPPLRHLVYVLKYFLLQRDLNEVFTGGVSSYSLILMVVSFLQTHSRNTQSGSCNLGELLLEFLELYGTKFNYFHTGIRVKEKGCYMAKDVLRKQMGDPHAPSILCIEDPLQPGNDIGRSSYGVMSVKEAFAYAYKTLMETVLHEVPLMFTDGSQLSRIIQVTDAVVEYRAMLHHQWNRCIAPPVSYASVVMGTGRKCDSVAGKVERCESSASCSELSSDAESDTSSHSSSSQDSSPRSYSSVASSGLKHKPQAQATAEPLRPSQSYNCTGTSRTPRTKSHFNPRKAHKKR